ncbi:hypothetical protein ACFYXM_21555 [Streptomyces sp. NPDC002476]|uniref:DUF7144 family membrane protein n=1 Tax=Streptomyces sp. NPDC002476 TaxID=3364648 RepID=UPI00369D26BA
MASMPSGVRQDTTVPRGGVRVAGPAMFVGVALVLSGVLSVLQGITGIARDRLYGVPLHYEYRFDLTTWGWIHLIVGIALLVGGFGMLRSMNWGRSAGIGLAAISLVTQFMFIPYYPLWAISVMTLDLVILWALIRLAV